MHTHLVRRLTMPDTAAAGSNLLRPPAAASTRSAAAVTSSGRTASWEARYAAPEPTAAAQLTSPEVPSALPNLQPISRMLDRQLQREQQQRKRLRKQLQRLERQLYNRTSSSSSDQAEFLEPFSSPRQADSDDPLFSTARPPSVQQLQRLVVHRRTQLLRATSSSISDVTRGEFFAGFLPRIRCSSSKRHAQHVAQLPSVLSSPVLRL